MAQQNQSSQIQPTQVVPTTVQPVRSTIADQTVMGHVLDPTRVLTSLQTVQIKRQSWSGFTPLHDDVEDRGV